MSAAIETDGARALLNVVNDDAAGTDTAPIDFAFVAIQTFGDVELERDVLHLFVAQARRVVPTLPASTSAEGATSAHLLKGSSRGIGAWRCADLADAYETADVRTRDKLYPSLAAAFERAAKAIEDHLAAMP